MAEAPLPLGSPYRAAPEPPPPPPWWRQLRVESGHLMVLAILIVPLNFWVFTRRLSDLFTVLALVQFAAGVGALVLGIMEAKARGGASLARGFIGFVVGLGGPLALWLIEAFKDFNPAGGGAWGRPLRLRGRILHPRLRAGSDWTRGARPDARDLDAATREALEALWLHDAQKEHASVPAFARISWLLAAVGAPAELMEGAHRAALEEIDHARRCFALAAGYGRTSHAVQPMPDLLVGGLELEGDPLAVLAAESLTDGCLLEDFNADVAAEAERECHEPAVKDVLRRIALEERSHAAFSWDLLEWLLARGDSRVEAAVKKAAAGLGAVPRPTAVSTTVAPLVARADANAMLRHGRIADGDWAALWSSRVEETRRRVTELLGASRLPKAS